MGAIHILAGESGVGGLGVLLKPTHVPENPMSGSFRHLRKQFQSYRPEKILISDVGLRGAEEFAFENVEGLVGLATAQDFSNHKEYKNPHPNRQK